MRVEWYGQAAFRLAGGGHTVFIDPFGDAGGLSGRGIGWEYPPIAVDGVDLVLVTHEHFDHNCVEAVGGEPEVVRAAAGRHQTGLGEVVGIASEHDPAAGTQRGANTIFRFELDGLRVAHFGDFGQSALRPEQRQALGEVDLLFLPVGGGPTIGGQMAADISRDLGPAWTVPMHYRTPRISFLESEEEFVAAMPRSVRLDAAAFETAELPRAEGPLAVLAAAP